MFVDSVTAVLLFLYDESLERGEAL